MARASKYSIGQDKALPSMQKWKAGLYLRLSKEDGDNDEEGKIESDSISSQRFICENYIEDNIDIDFEEEYIDDGISGSTFERPGFLRMIEDIRSGRINCIIVKDLSRFGRSYLEAGQYLEILFPIMNVRFISILDNIDSHLDPRSMNDITVSFKNVMNEEYCRDISKKIRSVFVAKRENGEYICGFALYGYIRDPIKKGQLLIDPEAADVIRLIFHLFASGKSYRGITFHLNQLGIPSPAKYKSMKYPNYHKNWGSGLWNIASVKSILQNRMYTGDLVQGKYEKISHKVDKIRKLSENHWIVIENHHEAIIDKEFFMSIQGIMHRDTRISQKSKELALFSGFLICADCKHQMVKRNASREKSRDRYHYYTCSTYDYKTKSACTRHTTRSDILEKVVFTVISKYIEIAVDMDMLIKKIHQSPHKVAMSSKIQASLADKKKEQAKLEKYLLDLYPDFKSDLLTKTQYLQLKDRYERELTKIKSEIQNLSNLMQKEICDTSENNAFVANFIKYRNFERLTRDVLIALVDVIYVHEGGGIEIHFKFEDAFQSALDYINVNRKIIPDSTDILQSLNNAMEVTG